MSIVSSFDNESKSIIDLDDIFKAPNHIADICMLVSCMKSITLQGLVSLLCMDPAGYLMWRNAKGI